MKINPKIYRGTALEKCIYSSEERCRVNLILFNLANMLYQLFCKDTEGMTAATSTLCTSSHEVIQHLQFSLYPTAQAKALYEKLNDVSDL